MNERLSFAALLYTYGPIVRRGGQFAPSYKLLCAFFVRWSLEFVEHFGKCFCLFLRKEKLQEEYPLSLSIKYFCIVFFLNLLQF